MKEDIKNHQLTDKSWKKKWDSNVK